MQYLHCKNLDIACSTSYGSRLVTMEEQERIIDRIAHTEPAPRAVNRAAGTEHCQGWTFRVLSRLVSENIVSEEKLALVRNLQQPI